MSADLNPLGVLELCRAYTSGEVTPVEVAKAALERVASIDPTNVIFLEVQEKAVLGAASESERRWLRGEQIGPLDGVPIGVKANLALAGYRWSAGIASREVRATFNASCLSNLLGAGAVVVGTTNLSEAAIGSVTANPWFGSVSNPQDCSRHAGGSSGGSAAAVSAGVVPAAVGTDTMGSLRIPAAYCGVAALKPTVGAVPSEGLVSLSSRLDVIGPIATNIDGLACLFSGLRGQDVKPVAGRLPSRLVVVDVPGLDWAIQDAFDEAIRVLSDAFDGIERIELGGLNLVALRKACLLEVCSSFYASNHRNFEKNRSFLSEDLRRLVEKGANLPSWRLAQSQQLISEASRILDELTAGGAVVLLPVTSQQAPPLTAPEYPDASDLTVLASAGGHPALAFSPSIGGPLGTGLQLMASRGADRYLLRIGKEVEALLGGPRALKSSERER